MKKQFTLTSTNPCVHTSYSDSYTGLLFRASQYATGEDNCDGARHWYCIINNNNGKCILYSAYTLVHPTSMWHPWNGRKLTRDALMEACVRLECTADELEFPDIEHAEIIAPTDWADAFHEYVLKHPELPHGYSDLDFVREFNWCGLAQVL